MSRPRTRRISGKSFKRDDFWGDFGTGTKKEAEQEAERIRDGGQQARVIKEKRGYAVYWR